MIKTLIFDFGDVFINLDKEAPYIEMRKLGIHSFSKEMVEINGKAKEGFEFYGFDANKPVILIIGGSLGARKINELIEENLLFFKEHKVQIIWQCGKLYYDTYSKYNENKNVSVHAFIKKMDLAYAAADSIISRSGASSVSELCIVGKPTIFIPSPNVAEDHQTKNAQAIADKKGAILVKESALEKEFEKTVAELITNESRQSELSQNIKKLAKPNATKDIVEAIIKLIN